MWTIYNQLIEGIPLDIVTIEVFLGDAWIYVNAKTPDRQLLTGIAIYMEGGRIQRDISDENSLQDLPLKEVAAYSKSWNFIDASIGMTAINAYYNSVVTMKNFGVCAEENDNHDAFNVFADAYKEKK